MNAKKFLKQVSPNNKYGIRADLKAAKIEKYVIDIMDRHAALYIHEASNSVIYEELARRTGLIELEGNKWIDEYGTIRILTKYGFVRPNTLT